MCRCPPPPKKNTKKQQQQQPKNRGTADFQYLCNPKWSHVLASSDKDLLMKRMTPRSLNLVPRVVLISFLKTVIFIV